MEDVEDMDMCMYCGYLKKGASFLQFLFSDFHFYDKDNGLVHPVNIVVIKWNGWRDMHNDRWR